MENRAKLVRDVYESRNFHHIEARMRLDMYQSSTSARLEDGMKTAGEVKGELFGSVSHRIPWLAGEQSREADSFEMASLRL